VAHDTKRSDLRQSSFASLWFTTFNCFRDDDGSVPFKRVSSWYKKSGDLADLNAVAIVEKLSERILDGIANHFPAEMH